MAKENLRKVIIKNTVANYIVTATFFITGIFLTRILYLGLGKESYGFWVWIWQIFGYSLLLDFGFGTSVQKYTAEVLVSKDYKHYNSLLSTVFGTYGIMTVLIIMITFILHFFVDSFITFPPGADIDFYKATFLFFGIGVAFVFPMGAFAEILRGLKKIYLRNVINFFKLIVNFIGIYYIFEMGMGLIELAIFSVAVNLLANIAMAITVLRLMPEVKIRPKNFKLSMLKEVVNFSFFAYLITFSNMIIFKTDTIVVGAMIGAAAIAIYQLGSKISQMMSTLTTQFQENLGPIAAQMYKAKEFGKLQNLLIESNRFISFITFFLFAAMSIMAKPLLYIWLEVTDPNVLYITYLLNISFFFAVIFRSGSNSVLIMANKHKFLTILALIEATANLVLSILFISLIGVVGVAIGTLIPNVILGLFVMFPASAKFSKIPIFSYAKRVYIPMTLISIPPAAILLAFYHFFPEGYYGTMLSKTFTLNFFSTDILAINGRWYLLSMITLFSSIAGVLYLILGYLFVLDKEERAKFKKRIPLLK